MGSMDFASQSGIQGNKIITTSTQYEVNPLIKGNENYIRNEDNNSKGLTMGVGDIGNSGIIDTNYQSKEKGMDLGILGATASSSQYGPTENIATSTVQKISTVDDPLITSSNPFKDQMDLNNMPPSS